MSNGGPKTNTSTPLSVMVITFGAKMQPVSNTPYSQKRAKYWTSPSGRHPEVGGDTQRHALG